MLLENINPRYSTQLYGLDIEFDKLSNLLLNENLPNVIVLTGEKGIGKFTLINHLVTSYFDKENYNSLEKKIISKNKFFENLSKNLISNVVFLESNDFKNINVEQIRSLKNKLQKKPFYNGKRFIILDDVETFNTNSINALLKLIEEPNENDYFLLINNKSRPLLIAEISANHCGSKKSFLSNVGSTTVEIFLKTYLSPASMVYFNSTLPV